ncbi:HTH domain-containing protein [archaeon]|nr:HTH domain-containing protein [archaeon]
MPIKNGISLGKADRVIVRFLEKSEKTLSTYEIAKSLNLSWATVNTHCYKLMSFGVIIGRNEEVKIGMKRIVWELIGSSTDV